MNNRSPLIVVLLVALIALTAYQFFQSKRPNTPPPPAAVLAKEAQALRAQGKYDQAISKYNQLATTYRGTPDAAEAIYAQAQILRDNLHRANHEADALNQLVTLQSQYRDVSYPDKARVPADQLALGQTIDYFYAHSNRSHWYIFNIPYNSLYSLMNWLVNLTGAHSYSYWIALVLISVIMRLLLTPLTIKQYKSMREMQRLQPLLKELQEKYKADRSVLGQKTMELYKEHGVNPAGGCVPMLIQAPVFSTMYWAVRVYQYHFAHGTFLWIGSALSHKFPQFLGVNLGEQDLPLLLLYSVSMYVTQRMMPATDPAQAEMQKTTALMTSVLFFIMFQSYHWASAFILYWIVSNILSTATQIYFMRGGRVAPAGVKPLLPSDGDTGGRKGGGPNGSSPFRPSGNGSAKSLPAANGSDGVSAVGTSLGVMAPKVHPKKKKRR